MSFWDGVEDSFKSKVNGIRELLRHQASGAAIEEYFRDLLCAYLPRRYIVESGFVVTEKGERSDYIDLLVVDALHIPPSLCNDPPVRIFAAESVVAAIEITSAPLGKVNRSGLGKIPKLQDDVLKLARVRELTDVRKYSDFFPVVHDNPSKLELRENKLTITLSSRTILITCGREGSRKKYEENLLASLQAAKEINGHVWVHLTYSLKHGLYRFHAHTEFEYRHIEKNAILEFLLYLNDLLSTYPTYKTDITRYRPGITREASDKQV